MSALSSQPYKGTRDYYPADKRVQNYIFGIWREVSERFGYEEYGAPLLEPLELYAAKTGQEIVNEQTYQFTDRGGRKVAIRPEMTPTISRMVAAQRQELGYPARLYSICQYMRYERPQHGREREFWQLNVDMFGVNGVQADAEILLMSDAIMRSFGATNKMYTIRINHRQLINYMMVDYLGLDIIQSELMIKLFDRKDKITPEQFEEQAADIFGPELQATGMSRIRVLLNATSMAELPPELRESAPVREVAELFSTLHEAGVTSAKFDISLMRGFDYYTGMVFEVFDNYPENNRAMFGGGRYDGLVGLFGVEPIATVGMAPGATTAENFLRAHNLMPDFESTTDIYMIVLGENTLPGAQKVATALRSEGVKVAVDITNRKLDKQIKAAVKMKVPYMLFIGEKELAEDLYRLKDVKSETELVLGIERIVTTVADYRRRNDDDI